MNLQKASEKHFTGLGSSTARKYHLAAIKEVKGEPLAWIAAFTI